MHPSVRFAIDTIDEIENLTDAAAIRRKIAEASSRCGYDAYVITTFPPSGTTENAFLGDNWPEEWTRLYFERNYHLHDRVAAYCRTTYLPFDWHSIPPEFRDTELGSEITVVARDFGLCSGRAVPMWRPNGHMGAIGFTGTNRVLDPHLRRAIDIFGVYAYNKIVDLAPRPKSPRSSLSKGEREVLSWIAAGKSSWEISEILGISERAVEWRLNQAFRKLDAVSRAQAVVIAITTGQISL